MLGGLHFIKFKYFTMEQVHPLKKLRQQSLEEFESGYEGKPSAQVKRMVPLVQKPVEEVKADPVFTPIREHVSAVSISGEPQA